MKTKLQWLLVSVCLLPMLASCIYDTYPDNPGISLNDGVEINLQIVAGGMATRSSGHTLINKGEAYESAINVAGGDYAIFIFDGPGKYLGRFEPGQILIKDMSTTTVGGVELYSYELSGVFQHGEGVESVQMLILANYETFGADYNALEATFATHPGSGGVSDLDYFFTKEAANEFVYSDYTDGTHSWDPQTRPGIPMTALSGVYPVNTKTIDLGPVTALRGLAKIEVVDMAPKEGAKILTCQLTGYNDKARFAPLVSGSVNTGWNNQSSLVSTPSLAAAGQEYKAKALGYVGSTREVVPNKETQKQVRNVYSFYVPEMMLKAAERPKIEITAEGASKTFEIELATYDGEGKPATKADGSPDYFENLLRNHLYRFNLLALSLIEGEYQLLIDTDQWLNDDDTYYYDDVNVAFQEGRGFNWNWKIDNADPDDQLLQDWGIDYDQLKAEWDTRKGSWNSHNLIVQASGSSGAEASFTFTEPERGIWTLALYCEEGTPNHWFQIEVWDDVKGEWVLEDQRIDDTEHNLIADTVSGLIAAKEGTPKEVKVRISANSVQSVGTYKARLVMNVRTFDGRMAEVDLMTGTMYPATYPESSKQYYYIIQYPISDL